MDITNISSFWVCLTILAQNVFEHFVSVYKITPCTCFDVLLATFLCENLICLCVIETFNIKGQILETVEELTPKSIIPYSE